MQVARRQWCWLAVAVLWLGVAAWAEEKRPAEQADKVGQELREHLEKFYEVIDTGSDEEIKDAVDHFVPNKAQVEAMFPNDADKFWPEISRVREKVTSDYKQFAANVRKRGKPKSIETVDVRKGDSPRRFRKVLDFIPEEVPFYQVTERYEKKTTTGSRKYSNEDGYVKVGDQWFLFPL